jgi:hypothetical protein
MAVPLPTAAELAASLAIGQLRELTAQSHPSPGILDEYNDDAVLGRLSATSTLRMEAPEVVPLSLGPGKATLLRVAGTMAKERSGRFQVTMASD